MYNGSRIRLVEFYGFKMILKIAKLFIALTKALKLIRYFYVKKKKKNEWDR